MADTDASAELTWRCELCGADAVAIAPGSEDERAGSILVKRGQPVEARCWGCLTKSLK